MAVPTSANYVFLPWVRQGAASGIQTPDSLSCKSSRSRFGARQAARQQHR